VQLVLAGLGRESKLLLPLLVDIDFTLFLSQSYSFTCAVVPSASVGHAVCK
jgi:hypothetical protein